MISVLRLLRESTGLGSDDINARTVTNADLNYSESFSPQGMDVAGIVLSPGNTATGTAPTIAAALEMSPDGGTTWAGVPKRDGSTASVTTGAVSTGSVQAVFCELPLSESGVASNPLYRWAFTYANADNDFVAVSAWLNMRRFNQRLG
jgi:hypothetical protein